MSTSGQAPRTAVRAHDDVLGYLVKHVQALLERRTDEALAPFAVTARDLGVLRVIAGADSRSQREVGDLLGVDRTSMVAVLDVLEAKGLVSRKPSASDRRRNLVALTEAGRDLFGRAEAVAVAAERAVVAELGDAEEARLRQSLRTLLAADARARESQRAARRRPAATIRST